MASTSKTKTKCKYGSKCYRKNQDHIDLFYHPGEEDDDTDTEMGKYLLLFLFSLSIKPPYQGEFRMLNW